MKVNRQPNSTNRTTRAPAPIRRRWAADWKEIARREELSARRLADWRRQQEQLARYVE